MTRQSSQDTFALLLVNFFPLQMAENEQQMPPTQRQIPVISDIERVKKVIAILELVGERVGNILETLPAPQAQEQRSRDKNEPNEPSDKRAVETSTPVEGLISINEASSTTKDV